MPDHGGEHVTAAPDPAPNSPAGSSPPSTFVSRSSGDEYILVPRSWRFLLSLSRVVLAAACLLVEAISVEPSGTLTRLVLILFILYAVVAVTWRILERVRYALFSLILDSTFFLIVATIQSEYGAYIASVFYLYLVTSTLFVHPWRSVAIVAAVLPLLFVLVRPDELSRMLPVLFLVGALGLIAARNRQLLIDRLIQSTSKAVLYRGQAVSARDAERERIAADFHDGPQQSFISLQMRLEVLRRIFEKDPEKAKVELAELQELTRRQVAEVRGFVRAMRPADVDAPTLAISISRLIDYFEKDSGISTRYDAKPTIDVADHNIVRETLQIVREALHNAQKHSKADLVQVTVEHSEEGLEIVIDDNGAGFSFDGSYTLAELDVMQLGPASIKRRLGGLNGDLILESHPNRGAKLTLRIPV
jgi:signal transduction histidine kinase